MGRDVPSIPWQHLQTGEPAVTLPGAVLDQDGDDLQITPVPRLQQIGDFFVDAEGRPQEVRRNQADGDLGAAKCMPDVGIPVRARMDLPIVPDLEIALILQMIELPQQLVLPAFVPMAVADEHIGPIAGRNERKKVVVHRSNKLLNSKSPHEEHLMRHIRNSGKSPPSRAGTAVVRHDHCSVCLAAGRS